jgi:hypothetical protein
MGVMRRGRLTRRSKYRETASMKHPSIFWIFLVSSLGSAAVTHAQASSQGLRSLQGTWVMEAAYEISADGTRATNFGEHPKGLFVVDAKGRYSLQIFRESRAPFSGGDKTKGTPDEYRQAVLGSAPSSARCRSTGPGIGSISIWRPLPFPTGTASARFATMPLRTVS